MRKALSIFGCLLLSMGTFAANEQTESLYDAAYWYAQGENASTNYVAAVDGEDSSPERVDVVATGDSIVYRTIYPFVLDTRKDDMAFIYSESNQVCHFLKLEGAPYYIEVTRTFPVSTSELTAPIDGDAREIVYNLNGKLAIVAASSIDDENCQARTYLTTQELDPDTVYTVITRVEMKEGAPHIRMYIKEADAEGNAERVKMLDETYEFPTLQQYNGYAANEGVHNVAFKGGTAETPIKVFNVVFTDVNHTSEPEAETVRLRLNKSEVVDCELTYSTGSNETAIKKSATVTLKPTLTSGDYTLGELTVSGNSVAVKSISSNADGSYTLTFKEFFSNGEDVVINIPVYKNNFTVAGIKYEGFQDAVNAAKESEDKKIALSAAVVLEPEARHGGSAWIQPSKTDQEEIVIDLNGQTLDASALDNPAIYNQGVIRIVDSVGNGKVVSSKYAPLIANGSAPDDGKSAVALKNTSASESSKAIVTIEGGAFIGTIVNEDGIINIEGGRYLEPSSDSNPEFYLASMDGVNFGSRFSAPELLAGDEKGPRFWKGIESESGKYVVAFKFTNGEKVVPSTVETDAGEVISTELTITDKKSGYDYDSIVWKRANGTVFDLVNEAVKSNLILIGYPKPIEYKITFDSDVSSMTYTVDSEDAPLPKPSERSLYAFAGWYYNGTTEVATIKDVQDLVLYDDVSLSGKWVLKELVWSNVSLVSKTREEANGEFPVNGIEETETPAFYWELTIPNSNGLGKGDGVEIKSISFWLVNAAPRSLERVAPKVRVDDEIDSTTTNTFISNDVDLTPASLVMRDKVRPELKYEFERPAIVRAGFPARISLASEEVNTKGLLRMIRVTSADGSIIGRCQFPSESALNKGLNREYRNYAPVFEVRGQFHKEIEE